MIRWKVFLPVFAIVILVGWFAVYRIDSWLKSTIESSISSLTGTKTDIEGLRLSFSESSLRIRRLQIASSRHELKNMMEFGDIIFDFQFLPLLEKRVVLDDFSIKGVDWSTDRESSGFLPPRQKRKSQSWMTPYINQAFNEIQAELAELPVNKLVDFDLPDNPKQILDQLDLKSEQALKEAIAQFQQSRTEWSGRFNELRDLSEYKRFASQLKSLSSSLPQDPQAIQKRISEIRSVIQFFQSEKNKVENLWGAVQKEASELKGTYDLALSSIEEDYSRAKDLVSIDQLNLNNLSRLIFGQYWVDRVALALQYHALMREKLALVTADEESVEVQQRASGRDIIFVTPKKKPSFVLAHSEMSVHGLENEDAGRLSQVYALKLEHLNSNPRIYGEPSRVHLDANFREALISRAQLNLLWDYREGQNQDQYSLQVDRIQANQWPVGIPRVFELQIKEGLAFSKSEFRSAGDELQWTNRIDFREVQWEMPGAGAMGFLVRGLFDVIRRIPAFFLEIEVRKAPQGEEKAGFSFKVRSDLDQHLGSAIRALIEEQLDRFLKRLRETLNGQIAKYQKEAQESLAEYQAQVVDHLSEKKNFVETQLNEAQSQIQRLEKKAKALAEQKAKEAARKATEQAKPKLDKLKNSLPKIKSPF